MFTTARIHLTIWYLLIIMLISVMFSFSLYRVLTAELEQGFHRISDRYTREYGSLSPKPEMLEPAYLQAEEAKVAWELVYVNLFILAVSGLGGYLLAGVTLKPIREMLDEQNRFIADASHELRTPLTSLKSEIEVYLRGNTHSVKESTTLLESNLEEVNNLQALSDNLLQLAHYQHWPKQRIFALVTSNEIIENAIKKVQKLAKQKNISIHTNMQSYTIKAHKENLTQVISILLDNAIKYSPGNTKITITSRKTSTHGIIAITDQGIGIGVKDKEHIFDRFYRADSSRTKQDIPGYGLGLAIAKKIIAEHHGSIHVTNTSKNGTTFTINLPLTS